jgi:acyl dehydratase
MAQKIPLRDIARHLGEDLGTTAWFEITQERIDRFADVTLDHQWMHVDVERANRERGGTIAHGLLIACLLPMFQEQLLQVCDYAGGYSYGFDKLRFTHPVRPGQRVRLRQRLSKLTPRGEGLLVTLACVIEIAGDDKPALVADYVGYYHG